jgi:hypothetical protein
VDPTTSQNRIVTMRRSATADSSDSTSGLLSTGLGLPEDSEWPQFLQNFASAELRVWQLAQDFSRGRPQFWQNLASSGFCLLQLEHVIKATYLRGGAIHSAATLPDVNNNRSRSQISLSGLAPGTVRPRRLADLYVDCPATEGPADKLAAFKLPEHHFPNQPPVISGHLNHRH